MHRVRFPFVVSPSRGSMGSAMSRRWITSSSTATPPPVDWTPATGWYRINADCTGEMELDIPGSPFTPVILRLSVGANGTHINTVVSKPGYVVSSTGTKVDQDKDDRD